MNNTSKSIKTMLLAILWGICWLGITLMHLAYPDTPPLGLDLIWAIIWIYGYYGYYRKD